MSAVTNSTSNFNPPVNDNTKIETPIGSIFNKNKIPVDLFFVKKDSNFNEDKKLYLKVYPGFGSAKQKYFDDGNEYLEYFFNNLSENLQQGKSAYIRAYANNRLVGYAAYDIHWRTEYPTWKKCIYVDHILIDPDYQKTGIGKELLFSIFKDNQIAEQFDSIAALVEWYAIPNPKKFYQKIGFEYVENPGFSTKGDLYKWVKK